MDELREAGQPGRRTVWARRALVLLAATIVGIGTGTTPGWAHPGHPGDPAAAVEQIHAARPGPASGVVDAAGQHQRAAKPGSQKAGSQRKPRPRAAAVAERPIQPDFPSPLVALEVGFDADTIAIDGTSQLTMTLTGSSPGLVENGQRVPEDVSGATFWVTLPGSVVVATAGVSYNSCGATVTATAASSVVKVVGTTYQGPTCAVLVWVTSAVGGDFTLTDPPSVTNRSGGIYATSFYPATLHVTSPVTPPVLTAAFDKSTMGVLDTGTLTLTLTADDTTGRSEIGYTVTLPTQLVVSSAPTLGSTCTGSAPSPTVGTRVITVSGAGIQSTASTCVLTVPVGAANTGTGTVDSTSVTADTGLTNSVTAQSVVVIAGPNIVVSFSPTTFAVGDTSTLTLLVTRPLDTAASAPLAFTLTLPSDLLVASAPTFTNTCGGTASSGDTSTVTLAGAGLLFEQATCTVSLHVTSSTAGDYSISGDSFSGLAGFTADITTQTVTATTTEPPVLTAAFSPTSVALGGTSDLTITITRPAGPLVSGLGFTVTLPAGLVVGAATPTNTCTGTPTAVAGASTVAMAGLGLDVDSTGCALTVPVTPGTAGDKTLTDASVEASGGLTTNVGTQTLTVSQTTVGVATTVTATAGVSSITTGWNPPEDTTGVTGYTATANPGPATCTTTGALSCVMGGTAGVTYTITVITHSSGGDSVASAPSNEATPIAPTPPATPPDTTLTLTTDQGEITTAAPGQQIVFIGTGFAAYSTVVITIYSAPIILGTVVTDGAGDFSKPITVPTGLIVGAHTVVAQGIAPDGTLRAMKLAVTLAGIGSAVNGLAVTGDDSASIGTIGGTLLAVGAVLIGTGRRRRRPLESGTARQR